MEAQKAQDVYDIIVAYIKEHGGEYSDWYAGIASNWKDRLFEDHQIPNENYKWWIARQCVSNIAARNVEDALRKLGCDGAPGGGDESTIYVYAYLKGSMTNP